jgi:uncharacterized protein YbaA (DUF1428 family)
VEKQAAASQVWAEEGAMGMREAMKAMDVRAGELMALVTAWVVAAEALKVVA